MTLEIFAFQSGPQREIFPGGTKIDAGPPKLGEVQKKKSSLHFGPKNAKKRGLHSNLVLVFAQN